MAPARWLVTAGSPRGTYIELRLAVRASG